MRLPAKRLSEQRLRYAEGKRILSISGPKALSVTYEMQIDAIILEVPFFHEAVVTVNTIDKFL